MVDAGRRGLRGRWEPLIPGESGGMRTGFRKAWTREETIVALGLYFQIPFGKINQTTPEVIEIAGLLGRTPSSLSMKMGNIGRLDPALAMRGIRGLKNGAEMEEVVWNEFADDRERLAQEFDALMKAYKRGKPAATADDEQLKTPPGLDGVRLAKYRVNQSFFRGAVLSAYGNACCITGLSTPSLLIASHIKPWARCENGNERTFVSNGLCLNSLHDRAFDQGLFTLDDDYRIVLSRSIREALPRETIASYFTRYEGNAIALPSRAKPDQSFLAYHREYVFAG